MYADDVGLVAWATSFKTLADLLNDDLVKAQKYFKSWFLTLNPNKTISVVFHLNNKYANRKLNLVIQGTQVMSDDAPKYLGIKLDRALTFNQYFEDAKNKFKTRNNILSKLVKTSFGCQANVLRTSALALVYSVAEFCASVWERSIHTKKVRYSAE